MEEKIKEKLEACFDRLQSLDIMPTLPNMEKLVQTLYDLRDIYKELGGDDNADSCGRDNH